MDPEEKDLDDMEQEELELHLLSNLRAGNLCDVLFEFVGCDKTENMGQAETPRKLKAHRLLLSYISPKFKKQFNGPIGKSRNIELVDEMELIKIKEFSYLAFTNCIKHAYGDNKVIGSCTSMDILFEMLLVSRKYMMKKCTEAILETILVGRINKKKLFPDRN